jgi:hypothetical protein
MANSSFGALMILMFALVAAIFMLTPHEDTRLAFNPPTLWSSQR